MKSGKRILSASLSMALCLYLMPVGALAVETNESAMGTGCICTELCTEEATNAECPVCSAEDADLAQCAGTKSDESAVPVHSDATDSTVSDVQALIDELPVLEELGSMDQKQQQSAYEQAQLAHDEYNALTDEQKAQIV